MFRSSVLRASRFNTRHSVEYFGWKLRYTSGLRFNSSSSISNNSNGSSEIVSSQLPSFEDIPNLDNVVQITTSLVPDASNQIGYLSSIGMAKSWWWPPDVIQNVLEYIHVYGGLPWWGTICVTTVLARVLLFPLYVKYSDLFGRTSRVKPELDKINAKIMECSDVVEAQQVAMKRKKLLSENGIKNRYLGVPMVQIPLAISFFSCIREMANYPVSGFSDQGIMWFSDLSSADPYLGLQCFTAALFISLARKGGESGAQQFSPQMKKLFTFLPLLTIPATMNLSSGVVLYLAVNGICSVVQTLLLRNTWVRNKLNIAEVVKHPEGKVDGPQKGIIETFRENMQKAREQAEKRQAMKEQQKEMEEKVKEQRTNTHITIVRRDQINKS